MPPELTDTTAAPFPDDEADLLAWGVMSRPDEPQNWVRVGSAQRNRDGSINLRLLAVPLTCEIHLRPVSRRRPRRVYAQATSETPAAMRLLDS